MVKIYLLFAGLVAFLLTFQGEPVAVLFFFLFGYLFFKEMEY